MFKGLLILLLFLSGAVQASSGISKGKIQYVRIHDKVIHSSAWTPPIFWFTIEGVTSAGSCKKFGNNVLFVMDTEQAYSMVMAAFMAEKEVSLRYDDGILASSTYCKATYLTVGNPPPNS